MTDLILHHYDGSPVAELVRTALGIKGARWRSVLIPNVAPKPELEPLTGGYRKTPVMQIGANIYCDSARIIDALEAQAPAPTLYPQPLGAMARMIAQWLGGPVFRAAAVSALAPVKDAFPDAFWEDRKKLFGLSREAMVTAPHMGLQFDAAMAWLEQTLGDGRAFLGGDAPGYADCAAHMVIWFIRLTPNPVAAQVFADKPLTTAFAQRMSDIGHGGKTALEAADALAIARAATPAIEPWIDASHGFTLGQSVSVATEDPGATPVAGTLQRLTDSEIAIARSHPLTGDVVVHFPRIGQVIRPA